MNVAVTGGSGVVGTAVVRHLVTAGHRVRALSRSDSSTNKLASLGADPVPGDVLDPAGLDRLVAGAQWVFNLAGVNEMCTRDPDHMWRVNVEGTRLVMDACRRAGVGRMIHTSSAVTIGQEAGTVGDEETRHRGWYLSYYEHSKTEAERLLFREASGLDVVAVNPSSVQGPGRATGTGRIFLAAVKGKLRIAIDTTLSLVDIDDCAVGHLLAAERGETGRRYLLSGATLTMREAMTLLSQVRQTSLTPRFVDPRAALVLAAVVEAWFELVRRRTPVCRELVRVVSHGHQYDGSRATTELGLAYTPVEETLQRTIAWFEEKGLLAT